jgi:Icc-related predicted phosphoesterase
LYSTKVGFSTLTLCPVYGVHYNQRFLNKEPQSVGQCPKGEGSLQGTENLLNLQTPVQLAWATDCHFEWLNDTFDAFIESLARSGTDGVIISGDISNSKHIAYHLKRLSELPMPVYFVLGNHDFYHGSFGLVHQMVRKSIRDHNNLTWLTEAPPIQLTESTYMIGHDGWADGRAGMGEKSGLILNDYRLISDFVGLPVSSVFSLMQKTADAASERLYQQIHQIGAKHIIVVTHAPPFREASKHRGRVADDRSIPHFSNIGMGRMLEKAAEETGARLSVFCGHTHHRARVNINGRIAVRVKQARYGRPNHTTIDVDIGVCND